MKVIPQETTSSGATTRQIGAIDSACQAEFERAMVERTQRSTPPKKASEDKPKKVETADVPTKNQQTAKSQDSAPHEHEPQAPAQPGQLLTPPRNPHAGSNSPSERSLSAPEKKDKAANNTMAQGNQHAGESIPTATPRATSDTSRESHEQGKEHDDQAPDMPVLDENQSVLPSPLQTPGDKLLASLQSNQQSAPATRDIGQLLDALQAHLRTATSHNKAVVQLHVTLPNLGVVAVQITHVQGQLQVDIQANPGSLMQLQQARNELMERLQKLNPEQPVTLSFGNSQNNDQGSRQRRHVHDEWEPEA